MTRTTNERTASINPEERIAGKKLGQNIAIGKIEIIEDLEKRVSNKILEPSNFDLLKKLVENADSLDEAIRIAELGTTYKRTGFHFDKRLEKTSDTIAYFKKNKELSFVTDKNALTHKLIIGDNYPALLNLLIEYKGRIDVIYIDPPYGKDNMGEFAKMNYENAITRDNLLSMLYPRLYVAKQLLSDCGVIFCSIDDRNQAYVKCLFDEIFGEGNFINQVIWIKNRSGKTVTKQLLVNIEYLLIYAKDTEYNFNTVYKPLAASTIKMYSKDDNDGRGKYRLFPMQKTSSPGPETTYDYIDNNGKIWKCPQKGWRMKREKVKALENDGRLCLENGTLSEKAYWNERESEGKLADTLWDDVSENSVGTKQLETILGKTMLGKTIFDNPKPVDYIVRMLKIATDENSIVLDFFAGSGTTGQAVLELNKEGGERQFILVTDNEKTGTTPNGIAIDVTSKRLRRVMAGKCYDGTSNFDWIKKNEPLGDNLDVLDIDTVSNFEAVAGKTVFDVIDETLYGEQKFDTVKEKVEWVCNNFENTQKRQGGE